MDRRGIELFLQWIDSQKPPFQTVVDLDLFETAIDLRNLLAYQVTGSDMTVTGFSLMPWSEFRKREIQ
jgi:hypothetical protein